MLARYWDVAFHFAEIDAFDIFQNIAAPGRFLLHGMPELIVHPAAELLRVMFRVFRQGGPEQFADEAPALQFVRLM